MYLDWLKALRNLSAGKRRASRGLSGDVATLEDRKLLTALPVGPETLVNSPITSSQRNAAVASDWDGNYVVAWNSLGQDGSGYGIYAQRYNAAGVAQGSEFPVNTYTTGNQIGPAISLDADGDFVIAWVSFGQDGSGYGIYAQRYNSSGVAQGSEFPVNTYTSGFQLSPSVALDKGGNFVIT